MKYILLQQKKTKTNLWRRLFFVYINNDINIIISALCIKI